ncbi:hypothetical protein B0T21DRAFT_407816 [Apiosordaria backusii]|uniref:Uncharacterized protein n=1 Tax=Apiosordaria backusii TaxID=314023 RepID=A0AA40K3N4_9PEZI|nr:hypothetical protein B0T21DRAFT_407816 [Apiosordaria backusii]
MPAIQEQQPAAPQAMQMTANPASKQIITEQPKSEPMPQMAQDEELNLRGGGFTIGCNCCRGMFSFHKRCC